jgi:hypothetical protein
MNTLKKCLLACTPLLALAACGGGNDLQDRLDLADPSVRFLDAAAAAPNLTLYKGPTAQPDASNAGYTFGSNYYDIGTDAADWSVKSTDGATTLGSVHIDPLRGQRYTIVALPASATENTVAFVVDPYNKPLTSESTRVRVLNAAYNAGNVDLYLNAPGTNIAGVPALVSNTAFKAAGPASGSDSIGVPGGTWQVVITTAGTKTVLFSGQIAFGNNQDVLLVTVPDATKSGGIGVLEKLEGTAGMTAVPTN